MKKLLIGLTLVASMSSYADVFKLNDVELKGNCNSNILNRIILFSTGDLMFHTRCLSPSLFASRIEDRTNSLELGITYELRPMILENKMNACEDMLLAISTLNTEEVSIVAKCKNIDEQKIEVRAKMITH
jgi:hypothetical protein